MTPRKMAALRILGGLRHRREIAELLRLHNLAARGEGKKIDEELRSLENGEP